MKFFDQIRQQERERAAAINARMEKDLLAEAYLHLEMRQRTRGQAQEAEARIRRNRSTLNAWPKAKRTA
jgi:hypothetical protein